MHDQPGLGLQNIIVQGQIGTEMYILVRGEVEVIVDEQILGYLREGSFFGEVCTSTQKPYDSANTHSQF